MISDRKAHHNTRLQVRVAAFYNNKELSGEKSEFYETDSISSIHQVSFPHKKQPAVNAFVKGPVCRIWMRKLNIVLAEIEHNVILIIMFSLVCNYSWIFVLH